MEYKPKVGDICIENAAYGYLKVWEYESEWRGWQDKLGYATKEGDYVLTLVQDMTLLSEDNERRYYRHAESNAEQVSVTPVSSDSLAVQEGVPREETNGVRSYTRTITTRFVTFVCAQCLQTVTQQRFPSPLPLYCSATCKKTAQREQTRLRVQQLRTRRKESTSTNR